MPARISIDIERLSSELQRNLIDSKTYITGWTGNQGNKRKLKDFVVRNAIKYEQSSHSRKKTIKDLIYKGYFRPN